MFDFEDKIVSVILWVCVFIVFSVFVLFGYACYMETTSEKVVLSKWRWHCTKTEIHHSTYYIPVGKIMVPQSSTSESCVRWEEK